MTLAGTIHLLLMAVALALGASLMVRTKGTPRHRLLGRVFCAAVLVSNMIVFAIHEDSPGLGVFHYLAMVSFASVLAGIVLARRRAGGPGMRIAHGHVMLWSFGGMVAAGIGQGATWLGAPPWPAILAVLAGVGLLAARLDFRGMLRPH